VLADEVVEADEDVLEPPQAIGEVVGLAAELLAL
jgi:hypothetical protein